MGCGCGGKGFSNNYATGQRYLSQPASSHVPNQQPAIVNIQSKSLQQRTTQTAPATTTPVRRKV